MDQAVDLLDMHAGTVKMRHRRVQLLARTARKHRQRAKRLAPDFVDLAMYYTAKSDKTGSEKICQLDISR